MAWIIILGMALVFALIWIKLARNTGPRAKIGPDGTNVREPETFVVHHEGKGQGLDIANTALKERTEHVRRELPGDAHTVKTKVPGRDLIRMDEPPSDLSRYGDEKVAPGAVPGMPHAESKEKVLSEGPKGSRPETPEEPGSPYAKGRRVTDNHRDVELAADLLPDVFPGQHRRTPRDMAASPSTTGQEPGYGLGRTAPGGTDGEGGEGDDDGANYYPEEQPELTDDIPDIPDGNMPTAAADLPRVVPFRPGGNATAYTFEVEDGSTPVEFVPDPSWSGTAAPDWSALQEEVPLPEQYGEDAVVAMVRNPSSLYVYWERSGFGEENLRSLLGSEWRQSVPVLRVFDVTSGAHPGQSGGHSWEIQVGETDDHWFINEGIQPSRRYVVSYERRTPDGQHYLISHSAPVQTPAQGPAQQSELYARYGRQPDNWTGSPWR